MLHFYKRQQFFPNLISVFINPFFFFRLHLANVMKKYANELNGRLLDFGCGSKPYKHLFSHVSEYIGIDVENEGHSHHNEHVDIYYDGKNLPFKDETFDSILSNEVLEHVPNLDESLVEINRILKPGGKILITVPFVCFEHELPYDFRRFTTNGLILILEKYGFEIIIADKTGNYFEVITQLWISYIREILYTKNHFVNIIINLIFISPFTLTGVLLSFILPAKKGLYFDTILVGRKR
ncbi:MAG: class I SAM-dependent methyltransferase [Tannerellaceae bacterium]|jgi:SAM-dependent methyltransferase|nr:class I SAM-dependent methyltransferase [Tannerellaceae bacterium]